MLQLGVQCNLVSIMTISELKTKLNNSLDYLKSELVQVRTGRVTPALLDVVKINAYGADMTIREVGSISVIDGQTLQVAPWDKSLLETIRTAIQKSELGLNPSIINDNVIVPIPTLTEERRKEFTRLVAVKVEEVKSSMRNTRQEAMKAIDADFEAKKFGEDEKFTKRDEVEDIVKEFVAQAEELGDKKKKELLTV